MSESCCALALINVLVTRVIADSKSALADCYNFTTVFTVILLGEREESKASLLDDKVPCSAFYTATFCPYPFDGMGYPTVPVPQLRKPPLHCSAVGEEFLRCTQSTAEGVAFEHLYKYIVVGTIISRLQSFIHVAPGFNTHEFKGT